MNGEEKRGLIGSHFSLYRDTDTLPASPRTSARQLPYGRASPVSAPRVMFTHLQCHNEPPHDTQHALFWSSTRGDGCELIAGLAPVGRELDQGDGREDKGGAIVVADIQYQYSIPMKARSDKAAN